MFLILPYISAFFMGAILGTLGGGGSILTVPIFVYLLGVPPTIATGYSLLIVGAAAAFGAFKYYKQGLIDVKPAITFAIPSIITVYLTRAYLIPVLPEVFVSSPIEITRDTALMVLFAILMVAAAGMMLRNANRDLKKKKPDHSTFLIIIEGAIVGILTGILGAGGGFLIIPALVLFIGMPMKKAVGASLLIIALKSLIGFTGDLQAGITLQMPMLAYFFCATIIGMATAAKYTSKFKDRKLQKTFAIFILVVAAAIFIKELV